MLFKRLLYIQIISERKLTKQKGDKIMTNDQLKDIFNSAIKAATNADQTAKLEVCREYFTNPEFKKDLENITFIINQSKAQL